MGFLDIGWPELLLILIVVLIIFGPGRMVEIGKSLGRTLRALKNASYNLTAQMSREIEGEKHPSGQKETTSKRPDEPNNS